MLADDARADAERRWPVPHARDYLLSEVDVQLGYRAHAEHMQSRVIPDEEIEAGAKALRDSMFPASSSSDADISISHWAKHARAVLEAQREVWNR